MPVSIPVPYESYAAELAAGSLALDGVRCPGCRATALVSTSSVVQRGIGVSTLDGDGRSAVTKIIARIAIARCSSCGARIRVLPADVLPRKTYSLSVVESCCARHVDGTSLRRAVKPLGADGPSHTTLHAWIQGLGAHTDGREFGNAPGTDSISAVIAETQLRHPELLRALQATAATVRSGRFRSDLHRERSASAATLLQQAALLGPADWPSPLTAWRQQALGWKLSSPFGFRTGIGCTWIELPVSKPSTAERRGADPPT